MTLAELCDLTYVVLVDELERDIRISQQAALIAAVMSQSPIEFEPFREIKQRFDDWLISPEKTKPEDERLVLLGLR